MDADADEMELLVRCELPKCCEEADVTCRRSWSVRELLDVLSAEFGFATGDVRLLSQNSAMDNAVRLSEYGLSSGDVVLLVPKERLFEGKRGEKKSKSSISFAGVATAMMMVQGSWRHVAVLRNTALPQKPIDHHLQPRSDRAQEPRACAFRWPPPLPPFRFSVRL